MKQRFTFLALFMMASIFGFAQNKQAPHFFFDKGFLHTQEDLFDIHHKLSSNRIHKNMLNTTKHRFDSLILLSEHDGDGKYIYSYDSQGNCVLSTEYSRENSNNEWQSRGKTETTYDIFGQVVLEIEYYWDEIANQWQETYKRITVYNGQQTGKTVRFYSWDQGLGNWKPRWRDIINYDSWGNRILILSDSWQDNTQGWSPIQKYTYSYNDSHLLTELDKYNWNTESNEWIISADALYTYNSNNKLILRLQDIWIEGVSTKNRKAEYAYNAQGNCSEAVFYNRDIEADKWLEVEKEEFLYDDLGNTSQLTFYEWNDGDMLWMAGEKQILTYNTDIPFEEVLWPIKEENALYQIISMPLTFSVQQSLGDDVWQEELTSTIYYSAFEYDYIDESILEDVQLIPNPVDNYFNIHFSDAYQQAQLKIYDMQGRLMTQKGVRNNENIHIENLRSGVYFYMISTNGKTDRGKLVKK